MEYTKGKWKREGWSIVSDLSDMRTVTIAEIRYGETDDEVIANARLIAVAPDLYEALKSITTIEQNDVPYDKYDVLGAINIAKQAIAKAEGGKIGNSNAPVG